MNILIKWFVSSLVVFVLAYILPGVTITGLVPALGAALVLGIINALLKPILILFTLPINILTLGLFTLVINALMLWFLDYFLVSVGIVDFVALVWATLVVCIVNFIVGMIAKAA